MKRLLLICLCCIGIVACQKEVGSEENIFRNTQWSCIEHDNYVQKKPIIFDFDLYCDERLTMYAYDLWLSSGEYLTSQSYKIYKVDETTWYIPNFIYNENTCGIYIITQNGEYADVHIVGENNYKIDNFSIRRNSTIVDLNKFIVD